jgi:manganese transport protein
LGMAIGLKLLFHFPLWLGICITVLDTFLLLFLLRVGMRKLEAFIIGLVCIIGISFLIEMFFARPNLDEVVTGLIPSMPGMDALYVSLAILGATVMPHNLYLHSSLVQTRKFQRSPLGIKKAIKFNIIDSALALNLALFVNAAILILAASAFFKNGYFEVSQIEDAYKFLSPLLGHSLAPILFAVALIAAGQSSTVTGTLAGQIIMEGHLQLRIQPWMRRLLTRMLAIIPALITYFILGEAATGKLLVMSQFILSMQLPFAIVPLIFFTSDRKLMGEFAVRSVFKVLGWLAVILIAGLNFYFIMAQVNDLVHDDSVSFTSKFLISVVCLYVYIMLFFIMIYPALMKNKNQKKFALHGENIIHIQNIAAPKNIYVTVDFSTSDNKALNHAVQMGGKDAVYSLLHVVETPGAIIYGADTVDFETRKDIELIEEYVHQLKGQGYKANFIVGYGNPKQAIPQLVNKHGADVLVIGTHGHKGFKDLFFGTTVEAVRHKISVPLLVV